MTSVLNNLLLEESPELAFATIAVAGLGLFIGGSIGLVLIIIGILSLCFLVLFYRWEPFNRRVDNHIILSPCEGTVVAKKQAENYTYVAIFLNVFNRHTQIYPVNGLVVDRYYDKTGKFKIVSNLDKSRDNEKVIHWIETKWGMVELTQIAGLLHRMIVFEEEINLSVRAGEYLGMMKFGSRVDMLIPNCWLDIEIGDQVDIGEQIGHFKS